jgi:hypothetical protein
VQQVRRCARGQILSTQPKNSLSRKQMTIDF